MKRSDSTSRTRERERTCSSGRSRETYRSTTNVPVVEGSVLTHRALTNFAVPDRFHPRLVGTSKFTRFRTIADTIGGRGDGRTRRSLSAGSGRTRWLISPEHGSSSPSSREPASTSSSAGVTACLESSAPKTGSRSRSCRIVTRIPTTSGESNPLRRGAYAHAPDSGQSTSSSVRYFAKTVSASRIRMFSLETVIGIGGVSPRATRSSNSPTTRSSPSSWHMCNRMPASR
jgi:hypothetical protein